MQLIDFILLYCRALFI